MKVLLTGASSFTGFWFAKELSLAGYEVFAFFLREREAYTGLRLKRVSRLLPYATPVFGVPFGSEAFLQAMQVLGPFDLFCHHASDVTNYKSPDFNVCAALEKNTHGLQDVLKTYRESGGKHFLWTGSVFEPGEGIGTDNLRAVSPYGLSKGLTTEYLRYYVELAGLFFGKFVIPNPFGPYEEERFCHYLMSRWFRGEAPCVASPDYVRDNVPVSLLAKAYAGFAADFVKADANAYCSPSFYVGSQGKFTELFAEEMRKRTGLPCSFTLGVQTAFPEPKERINKEPLDPQKFDWSEVKAWDEVAAYYQELLKTHVTI